MELSISEFAAACRLSVPALCRYAEVGVLVPVRVDERNGYRWYAASQVPVGVLVRTLRQLDVPLTAIAEILAASTPEAQLLLLDEHWARAERALLQGRSIRDYLARLLGGWQDLIAEYEVRELPVEPLPVLLRRRRGDPRELGARVAESVRALRSRADREALKVAGSPVSLHPLPFEVTRLEREWDIEVCLPVRPVTGGKSRCAVGDAPGDLAGDGSATLAEDLAGDLSGAADRYGFADAVLPGGRMVCTEVRGSNTEYPQVLAAFGAVAQWAFERDLYLGGVPLVVHQSPDQLRVGWCVPTASDQRGPSRTAVFAAETIR